MGMTLAEKLIARAAGADRVLPSELVTCAVDLAMIHDSGGPRRVKPVLERLGVGVWDPDKVVLISDHYIPAVDTATAEIQAITRKWATDNAIKNFHDMQGICHVVLPERGHLSPGMFVVGGDSHSPTGGAFGLFIFGVGATDMAGVLATGETWLKVPGTIRINLDGSLAPGVAAKDVMLMLCRELGVGGADYQVVEFTGSTIAAFSMAERMTMCNMAAELGAVTGIIAPDATTDAYITDAGGNPGDAAAWQGDGDAVYLATHDFDLTTLVPQVAAPHNPANSGAAGDYAGTNVHQAYIGACTGAKLEDLQMAASVLKGRSVAPGTRLLIAPASTRTTAKAAADGTLATLTQAGAIMMPSGCGACAGYGAGVLSEGETCIASTARNFRGRMGPVSSDVYLASPYTVAASAVAGSIQDPREMLSGEGQ